MKCAPSKESRQTDYYPFGMIMPDRSVEDNTVQCIPVTRSRLVNQVNTGDVLLPALDDHLEPPVIVVIDPGKLIAGDQIFNAIQASVVQLEEGGGGSPGEVISAQNGDETEVAGYISLPAITSGQTGLSVAVTNPSMNADGMMFFTLSKLNNPIDPDAGEQDLTQVQVMTAGESAVLEVNDGLNPGDVLRLWVHGIANNPHERGYLKVTVPSVVTSVITQTVQSYVAMSCDTDGAFQDGYRFGFNGKEKDNEVAGFGNQIDYEERIYDPRIARFKSVDPLTSKFPMLTPFHFASNMPIWAIDLDGKEALVMNTSTKTITFVANVYYVTRGQASISNIDALKIEIASQIINQLEAANAKAKELMPKVWNIDIKINHITKGPDGKPLTLASARKLAAQSTVNYSDQNGKPQAVTSWKTGVVVKDDQGELAANGNPLALYIRDGKKEENTIIVKDPGFGALEIGDLGREYVHEFGHFLGVEGHPKGIGTDPGITSRKHSNVQLVGDDVLPMIQGGQTNGEIVKGNFNK